MRVIRAMWSASGIVGIGGAALVVVHFSTGSPWLFIGLTCLPVAAILAVGAMIRTQADAIDDEFTSGYRSGFEVGREYAPRGPNLTNVMRRGHGQQQRTPTHHEKRLGEIE